MLFLSDCEDVDTAQILGNLKIALLFFHIYLGHRNHILNKKSRTNYTALSVSNEDTVVPRITMLIRSSEIAVERKHRKAKFKSP